MCPFSGLTRPIPEIYCNKRSETRKLTDSVSVLRVALTIPEVYCNKIPYRVKLHILYAAARCKLTVFEPIKIKCCERMCNWTKFAIQNFGTPCRIRDPSKPGVTGFDKPRLRYDSSRSCVPRSRFVFIREFSLYICFLQVYL